MRTFIRQANMADNNKQSKSNQTKTITTQTKTLEARFNFFVILIEK